MKHYPTTPDGRYFIVKGKLWRCQNPHLDEETARRLKSALGSARAGVKNSAEGSEQRKAARQAVNQAKIQLGERGPVWWNDGSPDENRKLAKNSSYAAWWQDYVNGE